jgi:curved DNA-binding protein CbpA
MTASSDMTGLKDPFAVLDLDEEADDDTIQRRYLALVRQHSPERDPDRFREIRAAYEAIRNKRDRLRARLLSIHDTALQRLKLSCLGAPGEPARPDRKAVNALLREGADRIWAESVLPAPKT